MAHLTEKQIERIWANRDNEYGQVIGNDILVKGCFFDNLDIEISIQDVEDEHITCGDFDENNYYLILNTDYYGFESIYEVGSIEDLINRYFN